MLKYVNDKDKEIVLVAIDFAGLTTNYEDLKKHLEVSANQKLVKKIITGELRKQHMHQHPRSCYRLHII